ncbi:MAG: hypothetical protein QGH20_09075, partial [Candidatus Latescibacteria bacterium]|nr:hypothetical protein [Candidatus Latescibacterota bacterium]
MRSAAGMSFSNRLSDWLSHAFAVDTPEQQLTQEDVALLDRVAAMIVKRGLISPAVMFLETAKPLNFIGSQVLVFLNPIVTIVFSKW